MKYSDKLINQIKTFLKFCIVGVSNTAIGYFIYLGVIFVLKNKNFQYDIFVANTVSFILSVLWSFFWNNRFVFKKRESEQRSLVKSLLKTYISYGFTGFILANILLYFWTRVLDVPKEIAPLLNLLVTVPLNYLLNKFWAFRSDKKKDR